MTAKRYNRSEYKPETGQVWHENIFKTVGKFIHTGARSEARHGVHVCYCVILGVGETGNFSGHVFKYRREHLYSIVQGVLTRNRPIFFAFLTIFGETALFSITNQQNC